MGVVLRKLYVWVAISIVLIAGCAKGNAEPVVRVGTNPSFAPASYKNDKRELTGFEHDAFEEIPLQRRRSQRSVHSSRPPQAPDYIFFSILCRKHCHFNDSIFS